MNQVCQNCKMQISEVFGDDPHTCIVCQQKKYLEFIHPGLSKYKFFSIWNVNITDYSEPIEENDSILIRVEPEARKIFHKLTKLYNLEGPMRNINNGKFIYFTNTPEKDLIMDTRFENYLYNLYSNSMKPSKINIANVSLEYADRTSVFVPTDYVLDIPISSIDDRKYMSNPPKATDIDVQLILDKIVRENCLFRGISTFYPENDDISASNYRNNKNFAEFGHLQKHEEELISNLLKFRYYDSSKAICAITDLRHSGKDTNVIDFTSDPKIALLFASQLGNDKRRPGEILILSTSEMEIMENLNYPIELDCILIPESVNSEHSKRVKVQSSIFIYCHRGFLPRDEYENKMENLLVDKSIKNVLLECTGYSVDDVYPDFQGFLENPKNFETSVVNYHRPSRSPEHCREIFKTICPGLENYSTFFFLDVELNDFTDPIISSNFALAKNNDPKHLGLLFDFLFNRFRSEDSKEVRYILACNSMKFYDRFSSHVKCKYPEMCSEVAPILIGLDLKYMDPIGGAGPNAERLKLSVHEITDIIDPE